MKFWDLVVGQPVSVLFTSRRPTLPWVKRDQCGKVEAFKEAEVEEAFRSHLGEETAAENRESLLAFAKRVERLPIAITVGADYLRNQFGSVSEAAKKIKLAKLINDVHDVPGLFRAAIAAQGERERRLLGACAVCSADGFWLPLAIQVAGLSEDDGNEARDRLVNASLLRVVDRERRRFQIHALLREQLLGAPDARELRESYVKAVEKLFKKWEIRWKDCFECLAEAIPACEALWLAGESKRGSSLAHHGFACSRRVGELTTGMAILRRLEEFWESSDSPERKANLQRIYGREGLILADWGRMEEALELQRKKEAICRELENKGGLQASYGNQAVILRRWGRAEEAFELLKKQEAICLEMGDRDGLQASYGNQAVILHAWGRLEEALELLKKQEEICQKLGNKDGLQRSYGVQALILKAWGRLEEALDLLKKKEEICRWLGNKDGLQRSYGNQAQVLADCGRLEEALELHKKEEAICEELGNKDGLQRSYGNQAQVLADCGRLEEALELLRKQEAICQKLGSKEGLGYCYLHWGTAAQAQSDSETAKEKLEAALGIFTELKMPRERDGVKAELEKVRG
jgi:tetratricopeptide (TPR) repeat protein